MYVSSQESTVSSFHCDFMQPQVMSLDCQRIKFETIVCLRIWAVSYPNSVLNVQSYVVEIWIDFYLTGVFDLHSGIRKKMLGSKKVELMVSTVTWQQIFENKFEAIKVFVCDQLSS